MKRTVLCLAIATLAPMLANAARPGQYDVGGIQQICLVPDGTWYGTTYSGGWGGVYKVEKGRTFIFGNWDGGAGNDSMNFGPSKMGHWTEWTDDLTTQQILPHLNFTFVKADCDPPPTRVEGLPVKRPMEK